ncbi:toprim domain-containing protein [Stappia taiwanensis]|uniref:Toprim domain-containing protein n=1 Tax=Stappia taiwanensis TaxID=992267 RepID=A0A838XVR8_9HYPH|nr:toprim domain-containing protein [Stappia taiwanensis]MBA4613827.1 toprim domain-containing protein [Stappia taiwanensis]GGE79230.1 hypothetical protein GCM10007285_03810 [Stappia taiwanensis]
MSDRRREVEAVKQGLKDRIEDLCRRLLPHGRRIGRLWVSNNPITADHRKTPELKVALTGDKGAWKDWRSGDKGDVVGLVQYLHQTDFRGALQWSRDFLGFAQMTADQRRSFAEAARVRAAEDDEKARRRAEWERRQAEKLFDQAMMDGAGSAAEAHARAYLRARAIDLDKIRNRDRTSLRYAAQVEYWTLAEWSRDERGRAIKTRPGPLLPGILAAMRSPLGQIRACHVTFLDPVKPEKAVLGPKNSPRLMKAPTKGAAVWISHGPEGVPPWQATQPHPLVLSEGIETGERIAMDIPEARVAAGGSITGIGNVPVNFDFISAVIVAGENDWDKPQAQRQLDRALAQLEASGKPVELMRPHAGSDFNDLGKGDVE